MQLFIIIASILATLLGWYVTYEPFGVVLVDADYWYWYDIAKSAPMFFLTLSIFIKKPKYFVAWLFMILYFGANLIGDCLRVNEKGNWFTYLVGCMFILLIASLFTPKKWALYLKRLMNMEGRLG